MKHNNTLVGWHLVVAGGLAFVLGCPSEGPEEPGTCSGETRCASTEDMPADLTQDMASDASLDAGDVVEPPDATTDLDAATPPDQGSPQDMSPTPERESEPNDGAMVDEVNPITPGTPIQGSIGAPGDRDIFSLMAAPGQVYEVVVTPDPGSMLDAHLTAIDAGRGGDAPGEDYVKIDASGERVGAKLQLLVMGEGGYFLALRDQRDVDGDAVGSPRHTYTITAQELRPEDVTGQPLTNPAMFNDALTHPGDVRLYPFSGTAGQELDVTLTGSSMQLDARLYVWSRTTGSWIARNDTCIIGQRDPCLSAPLTASGEMLLVVENIEEGAQALGYDLRATWE